MDSLGAVGSQDAPVLAHAPRNGQARLVPHGFGEGELRPERKERWEQGERESAVRT